LPREKKLEIYLKAGLLIFVVNETKKYVLRCRPTKMPNSLCLGQDRMIKSTIGEITNVSSTTKDHIQKYGTYTYEYEM
jgi:hypothetical protein